jgi:hypothetical protein
MSKSERIIIIILDPIVTPDDFTEGAYVADWELVEERKESESSNYEQIYRAGADGKSTVHYVADQFVKVRYALARGPDAERLATRIKKLFDFEPDRSLLAAAEKERDDLQDMVDGLMSATVLGDQAGHARLAKLVEKRLAHENSAVRRAALISVSWLEWPDFRKTVEHMAKEDPAKDVREAAGNLAESYRLRDKGKL